MTVWDLTPESGRGILDGMLLSAAKDAEHKAWILFWKNTPQKYQDMYIKGYEETRNPPPENRPSSTDVLCNLLGVFACIGIPGGVCLETSNFHTTSKLLNVLLLIVGLFLAAVAFVGPWFFFCRLDKKKEELKSPAMKFYDAVNVEIKKLEDEVRHDELLSGLKFMGATTIGVMAGLVTGHLGAAIAAAKVVSGEGVTAANLVSAATGVGGLSELADAADMADAIDAADTADAVNSASGATNAFSHVSDTSSYSGNITVDSAGHIMDEHNLILGRFDGQHIFDSSNSIAGTINGNHLLGANGDIIGTISGDKIMGSHGDIMYRVDTSGNVFDNHNMIIGKIS